MLSLPPSVRLFVATQPVDGRKGADSLMVIVRDVFATRSAERPSVRLLLEAARPRAHRVLGSQRNRDVDEASRARSISPHVVRRRQARRLTAIEAAELALIIEGIDLAGARRRPRWEPRKTTPAAATAPSNSFSPQVIRLAHATRLTRVG